MRDRDQAPRARELPGALPRLLPKLLVVEDDPGLQAQLKWAYDDFEVFIAGDRTEALALLRSEEPAVVTLDLGLPPDPDGTTEGLALLDAIMTMKPDTKVIVASGHGARESARSAIARGAYDFYQKPVRIDELGLIVRRALHVQRIEAENRRLADKAGEDSLRSALRPKVIRARGVSACSTVSGRSRTRSRRSSVVMPHSSAVPHTSPSPWTPCPSPTQSIAPGTVTGR